VKVALHQGGVVMDSNTDYLVFVVLGVVLVLLVGQLLVRAGQVYLEEVFPDRRVASSVSRLLAVLFYLFALGLLGIISTMDVPVEGAAQVVVTKLGVVLVVLGIVYAVAMVVLSRIRSRRREEDEEEAIMAASMPGGALHPNGDDTNHDTHHDTHHDAPHDTAHDVTDDTTNVGPDAGSEDTGTARTERADTRLVQPTPPPAAV
jgi:hypothetical protein